MGNGELMSRALGVFSLGLGALQVATPASFAEAVGLAPTEERRTLVRAVGAREVASGLGLLARRRPVGFMWSRVAGDVLDLALLARSFRWRGVRADRLALVVGAVGAIMALDLLTGMRLAESKEGRADGRTARASGRGIRVRRAVTVNRSPDEVYRFWRNFENLPRFMHHLESVEVHDDRRSRWVAKAPLGRSVEWEAELTDDRPGERISWRSVEDADVQNWGTVTFRRAPGERGTEVIVELEYMPPAGKPGALVAKLFGEEPEQQIADDLRRFKQVIETGDVVVSEAVLGDRRLRQRPAQPPALA